MASCFLEGGATIQTESAWRHMEERVRRREQESEENVQICLRDTSRHPEGPAANWDRRKIKISRCLQTD